MTKLTVITSKCYLKFHCLDNHYCKDQISPDQLINNYYASIWQGLHAAVDCMVCSHTNVLQVHCMQIHTHSVILFKMILATCILLYCLFPSRISISINSDFWDTVDNNLTILILLVAHKKTELQNLHKCK